MRKSLLTTLLLSLILFSVGSHVAKADGTSFICGIIHAGYLNGVEGDQGTNGNFGQLNAGETVTLTVTLLTASNATFTINYDSDSTDILVGPASAPGTLSFSGSTPAGIGFYIQSADGLVNVTMDCTGGAGAVTWFNPGDGRVDPRPGDRLAMWCNPTATPANVTVYGVGDWSTGGSTGFLLGQFNYSDLLKAGAKGITKDAGKGNGAISLMTDGTGDFYAAWNGGSYHATGLGDFSKSFSCTFQ